MSRDRVVGFVQNHIFGISDLNLPIHYITFMGLQRRLRGVYMGAPPLKSVLGRNFSLPSNTVPQMAVFRELRGFNVNVLFSNPQKTHPCAEPRLWRILRENRVRGLGCGPLEVPGKKKPSKHFDAEFRAYGEKKPIEGSWLNFICGYFVCVFCMFVSGT